jgi:hypothetical protein
MDAQETAFSILDCFAAGETEEDVSESVALTEIDYDPDYSRIPEPVGPIPYPEPAKEDES